MIAGSTVLRILDRAAVMLSTAARARSFMAVRSLDRLPIPGIRPNHRLLSILGEPIHDNGPHARFVSSQVKGVRLIHWFRVLGFYANLTIL